MLVIQEIISIEIVEIKMDEILHKLREMMNLLVDR
jgi:hypothetical protein